jgi:MFS family permease
MPATADARAGRAAFTHPGFVLFQIARFLIVAAVEMQAVAVGWQVYEITKRPLDLGYVGLAQFLPAILLFPISGHASDRFERRNVLSVCYAGYAVCFALLLALAQRSVQSTTSIYVVLVLIGIVRSFNSTASRSILPQLVPEEHFPNAVAWNASIFQAATILGPSFGGILYAAFRGPSAVYVIAMITAIGATLSSFRIKPEVKARPREPMTFKTVFAGLHYIWRKKLILGAISLDLFAVLLGGAVALLPVYAREILHTGPWGLGLLRTAPGVGAAMMAVLLAHRPLRGRSGTTLLWAVAGFGIFTIIFGVSRSLTVSLIALLLLGASDMVSVIIRATLTQLATPDEMRGRVTAVDMIFIGTSNEFGQFESGVTAQWFGTVPAVILGGVGTLVVIALWAWWFPELRQAGELHSISSASLQDGSANGAGSGTLPT